jgi:hypothetical protein
MRKPPIVEDEEEEEEETVVERAKCCWTEIHWNVENVGQRALNFCPTCKFPSFIGTAARAHPRAML